jgi:hypothetical protein
MLNLLIPLHSKSIYDVHQKSKSNGQSVPSKITETTLQQDEQVSIIQQKESNTSGFKQQ